MNRWSVVTLALCCGLISMARGGTQTPAAWAVTGNDWHHYQVQGSGDPVGDQGATVTLRAQNPDPGKFGGSITVLDAKPYRGGAIRLSTDLDTRDALQGAAIWLRADDAANKSIAFANSQHMLVVGTLSGAHREVIIDVPTAASRIALGTFLYGNGEVAARHLRLAVVETPATAVVAPGVVLNAAIRIVRANALRAGEVNWNQLEPELHAMAKDAKAPVDVYPAIRRLLASLGDHHSSFMEPWQAHQEQVTGGPSSPSSVVLKRGGIGYIDMPGYRGMKADARRAFVAEMVGSIDKIALQARCGWVVDLRRDTGGSMLPMLSGLHPLLGDQPLGSFRYADGHRYSFGVANRYDKVLPQGPALEHAAVAVLLGPHTASSGEVVAVAFRGRPNTRSFGLPTAGLSTGNAVFALPDGSMIVLTTAVDVDRTGHAYGDKLTPDHTVEAATTPDVDPTLDAAQAWLASFCVH